MYPIEADPIGVQPHTKELASLTKADIVARMMPRHGQGINEIGTAIQAYGTLADLPPELRAQVDTLLATPLYVDSNGGVLDLSWPILLQRLCHGRLDIQRLGAKCNEAGLNCCLAYAVNSLVGAFLLRTVGDFLEFLGNHKGKGRFDVLKSFFQNGGTTLSTTRPFLPGVHVGLGKVCFSRLRRCSSWTPE